MTEIKRPARSHRITNPFISLLALLIGLPVPAEGEAAAASAVGPNFVIILADDHSCNAISAYGGKLMETPHLDRLASRGMRFDQAMVSNSICSPSRATLLTGKYSHKNGVYKLRENFDGSQPTFPKLLRQAGYQTALFGKWHLASTPTGFDHFSIMRGQGRYDDCEFHQKDGDGGMRAVPSTGYVTDVITDQSLAWLGQREADRPFCLMIHHKAPHGPHDPAPRHRRLLESVVLPEPSTLLDDHEGRAPAAIADKNNWSRLLLVDRPYKQYRELGKQRTGDRAHDTRLMYQAFMKGYLRLVAALDENVGRVLDHLDEAGLSDNTVVIYSSDNGFFNGERGFYNKMWMYEPSLRVPLLIRAPGVRAGSRTARFACLMDLAPTLLDYAGCPIPEDMQGHSLRPLLEGGDRPLREAFYYHHYGSAPDGVAPPELLGVRTRTHKLIHYPSFRGEHRWELFDLTRDPAEMDNLHGSQGHQQVADELKDLLKSLAEEFGDPVVIE